MNSAAGTVTVLVILAAIAAADPNVQLYVYINGPRQAVAVPHLLPGKEYAAWIKYYPYMQRTGWDILNVTTTATVPDKDQAYAAGFGEGYATYLSMGHLYVNIFGEVPPQGSHKPKPIPPKVEAFVNANLAYMDAMIKQRGADSNYWFQVGLIVEQFYGMLAGYNARADPAMTFSPAMLMLLAGWGDANDLFHGLNGTTEDWRSMSKHDFNTWFALRTHCTSLVKLLADGSDIFFAHTTWATYNTLVRSFKHYNFNFDTERGALARRISFSGFAGSLASVDDFYVTDTGLAVMETSFSVYNMSLYKLLKPQTLLTWVRAMVASRTASSGKQWAEIFAEENSGTYSNQWQTLDYNLFTPGKALANNTLTILETLPGVSIIQDATPVLRYGYWPSYNVPSIPAIYKLAGYPEALALQGADMNDYETSIRAQILRRDHGNVFTMSDMMFLMQYNDYKRDPLSKGDPSQAIAARGDFIGGCWGGVDSKITSNAMMKNGMQVLAYSGPTQQQGTFDFANTTARIRCSPRYGEIERWDFLWQQFRPQW